MTGRRSEVSSFVPAALLRRLNAANATGPVETVFSGAVLFADVVQYTELAERLCEQGPEGVEQLAAILDKGFSAYVGCVRSTGGEVAEFAGDALVAYWEDPPNAPGRALRRAQECAGLLHVVSADGDADGLAGAPLHIGIGTGDIWAARLGGMAGTWHLLFAGSAVRDATSAAGLAGTGETVLSESARSVEKKLLPRAPGQVHEPQVAYAVSQQDSDVPVDGLVPQIVQKWLSEGLPGWLPQMRTVAALFLKIEGLDERTPRALQKFQNLEVSLQTTLRPYTSSNGVLVVDDKGLIFKLCLGLPNDSHSDDIFRAVRAGFALESELDRLGLKCAAGVATGKGICMPIGGLDRQHYVAVGRFMHLAARLMQEAEQGILCTDEVAERVRHELGTSPLKPVKLKGIKGSTRPFRVHEPQLERQTEQDLFGREDETRLIDDHLDALAQGHGNILNIVGEAGIGKTALVSYLKGSAIRQNIVTLEGVSASIETVTPYTAWRAVFEELLDIDPRERLERFSRMPHPELAPLVNGVVEGVLPESEAVARLSEETRAKATVNVLSQVIGQFAPPNFVLILEDCHWMDSASWRLLSRVVQDHPNALFVLTSRPASTTPELEELRQAKQFSELALAPLSRTAVRKCVESMVSGEAAAHLIEEITDRALGNPLYAREYSLLLTSHGGSRFFEGEQGAVVSLAHDAPKELPETVQGLITSRLDALSVDEAFLLKSCSVLGDRFSLVLLRAMDAGSKLRKLEGTLASLVEKQMLVQSRTASLPWGFRHPLIREVTYEQLTSAQKRELHANAARAIETVAADHLEPQFATLAHHWQCAGDARSTIRYSDLAASQALHSGAYKEAARWLGICLDLPLRERGLDVAPKDRIRWSRQLADAHHGLGRPEPRGSAARDALAIAGRNRPHTNTGIVTNAIEHLLVWYALRMLPQTRDKEKIEIASDLARAYRHSAEVCYFNNDMLGMIHDCLGAARMAEHVPVSAIRGSAYTELGGILGIAGLHRFGERIRKIGVGMAEAAAEPAALAHVHMVLCLYAIGTGQWEEAQRNVKKCQELCEPIDDSVTWTNAQAGLFWLNHYQYKIQAAFEAARRLQDRAYETGNRQHQAWALRYLSLCDLRWNKPEAAVERLETALALLEETGAVNERIPTFGLLALAKLRAGDVWSARATARDGIALLARVGRPIGHSTLEAYSALAEIVFDAWRQDPAAIEWRSEAHDCQRMLRRYKRSFPIGQPRYWLRNGEFEECLQNTRQAAKDYRRGRDLARRLGMPWEAELCSQALSRLKA